MGIEYIYDIYRSGDKHGLINFSSAKIELSFYENSVPPIDTTEFFYEKSKSLYKCEFVIDDLPVNEQLRMVSDSDFTSPDAKLMFDMQHQKIFDEISKKYGIAYL